MAIVRIGVEIDPKSGKAKLVELAGGFEKLEKASKQAKAGVVSALSDIRKGIGQGLGQELFSAAVSSLRMIETAFMTVIGAAAKYETAFAGVRKTVDASEKEFQRLSTGVRGLAKELPLTVAEIARVTEAAGQLGVKNKDLLAFTDVMSKLGFTTNLSSEEAATGLARFNNIVTQGKDEYDRLGSTIVALGNNFATTEQEIVAMALRLAGAGEQVNMSRADILGLATTLSSVGIEAEAGGSAMSRVMIEIALAAAKGGSDLQMFAQVAGMSSTAFKKAFEEDAAGAIVAFVAGLGKMKAEGGNVLALLEAMGIKEIRMRDALLRTSAASDVLRSSIGLANDAYRDNNALNVEAEQRIKTTESQWQILQNQLNDVAITAGNALLPAVGEVLEGLRDLIPHLESLARWLAQNEEAAAKAARQGFGYLDDTVVGTSVSVDALNRAFHALTQNPLSRWLSDATKDMETFRGVAEFAITDIARMLARQALPGFAHLAQIGQAAKGSVPAFPTPLQMPGFLDPFAGPGAPSPLRDGPMTDAQRKLLESMGGGGKGAGGLQLPPSDKDLKESERRQKKYLSELEKFEKAVIKAAMKAEADLIEQDLEAAVDVLEAGRKEFERLTRAGNVGIDQGNGLFADPQVLREAAEAEERINAIGVAADEAAAAEARAAAQAALWFAVFDAAGAVFGAVAQGLQAIGLSADNAAVKVLRLAEASANFGAAVASGDVVGMITSGFELAAQIKSVFDKPEFKRIGEDVGRRFGVAISEGLAKAIEETESRLGVGRHMAELLSLGDIMGESARDAREFAGDIGDLLNAIKLGAVPAEQGMEELGEAFGKVAAAALEAGSVGDKALLGIIMRARELGLQVPAIQEFVRGQLSSATGAMSGIFGTRDEDGKVKGGLEIATPEQALAQATIFTSTFWAAVKEQGLVAAVDAMAPAFAALHERLSAGGFDVGALLGGVGGLFDAIGGEGPARDAVMAADALKTALEGVANAGYLTKDSFAAYGVSAQAAFEQATEAGLATPEAYQSIAPLLASIISASENYGFAIDENTQKLIDQAKANGLAFPTNPTDRLTASIDKLIETLGGVPPKVDDIGKAIDRLPGAVTIPVHTPTNTGIYGPHGDNAPDVVPGHAAGYFNPSMPWGPYEGGATLMAVHPRERVEITPASQTGTWPSAGPVNNTFTFNPAVTVNAAGGDPQTTARLVGAEMTRVGGEFEAKFLAMAARAAHQVRAGTR